MRLSDGTEVSANEWFVFGRCVKRVEANPPERKYGFRSWDVFPMRSGADEAGRKLVARLVEVGLLSCKGYKALSDTVYFISDKGWEAWRTR